MYIQTEKFLRQSDCVNFAKGQMLLCVRLFANAVNPVFNGTLFVCPFVFIGHCIRIPAAARPPAAHLGTILFFWPVARDPLRPSRRWTTFSSTTVGSGWTSASLCPRSGELFAITMWLHGINIILYVPFGDCDTAVLWQRFIFRCFFGTWDYFARGCPWDVPGDACDPLNLQ